MAKDLNNILLSTIEENKIKEKTPDKLPLNPTAEGWSGHEVRRFLAKSLIDNEGSFLAVFKKKMIEIKAHFEDIYGQGDGNIQKQIDDILIKIDTIEETASALSLTVFNNHNYLNAIKVNKTLTILGIDLQDNITLAEFKTALGDATDFANGLMSALDKQNLAQTMLDIQSLFSDKADKTALAVTDQNIANLQNDKVNKTQTIMDLDFQDNITRTEVVNAIGEATQILSGLMSIVDKQRLDALHTMLGVTPDADNVVNTINEIMAIFATYPEGADILTALNGKVDKVSGKQLSTNDLTDVLKNNYDVAYTHSQVKIGNPHEVKFSELLQKPIIPSKTSELTNDSDFATIDYVDANSGVDFYKVRIYNEQDELITTQILHEDGKVEKIDKPGYLFDYGTRNEFDYNTIITEDIDLTYSVIPPRYVQTSISDFGSNGNYIGPEEYIILPKDKTRDYKIINSNLKGVATNGNYLKNASMMFYTYLSTTLELDYLDTSNVTDMSYMFNGATATSLDVSNFDTSNVTDMSFMFYNTKATTLDLSNFDTSNVTSMGAMFYDAKAITLDLSNFDTRNVTGMSGMFNGSQATTLDLSSFDTSNVTNMGAMFTDSQATELDLSSFDTSKVTVISQMFTGSQATIGYARTQTDADNFNSSYDKPSALNFIVKEDILENHETRITENEQDITSRVKETDFINYQNTVQNFLNGKIDKKPDGVIDLINAFNKIDARYLDLDTGIFIVVETLPATGVANNIYLVPSSEPQTQNELDEFIWVDNAWEKIGSVSVDLSNYFNKTEINSMLDDKVEKQNASASGQDSTALGRDAHAEGFNSIALGLNSSASGGSSTALGRNTTASGNYSTALGDNASAEGIFSIALGLNSSAEGTNSIAIGTNTKVTEENVVDFGEERQVRVNETPDNDRDAVSKRYLENVNSSKQDKLVAGDNITIDENTNVISASGGGGGTDFHRVRIFDESNKLVTTQILYEGEKLMEPSTEGILYYYNTDDEFDYNNNITEDIDLTQGGMLPSRYIQTTTSDFDGNGDYIGTEEYIILPEDKPDGYNIVNPNVIGVATSGDYLVNANDMFYGNPSLYLELNYIDTSNVTHMAYMFNNSQATILDLSSFNTSNVENMNLMFSGSQATIIDLSSFDTSNVWDMGSMFSGSKVTTLDLSSFDTSNVTEMGNMFAWSEATTGYARTQVDADNFNNSFDKPSSLTFVVKPQPSAIIPPRYIQTTVEDFDIYGEYLGTEEYIILPEDKPDNYNITNTNVKGVATNGDYLTNTSSMFNSNTSLYLELDYLNTSNVTEMIYMFFGSQATTLDLSNFDTSNVITMNSMFRESQATTLDLSSFDTSNVTDMIAMFDSSHATTLDLSSFDTSNIWDTHGVFVNSQATTGYARTQVDADNFNSDSYKPSTLTFVVK